MDLASLNIEVKSTGVAASARALDSLIKVAASGDMVIRNVASSLNYLRGQDFTSFAKNIQSISNVLRGTTGGFKEFVTSASSLNKVSTSFTSIATATEKLSGNSAGLSAIADQLDRIKNSLVEMKGSTGTISRLNAGNVNVRSGGGGVSRPESTDLTQTQNRIISQLEREAYLVNHTKAQWLEYRAAQAGVTTQAQTYINTLRQTTQATNTLGMTQKGYNASLRGVPAQFTDIIVSLQGGQAPLTVLLQQGGQLKDMFGTVGNAVKALGGYLLKLLLNPVILAIAAIGTISYALYKGSQEMSEFAKATALTNGYIGISKGQFADLSREVAGSTGNISGAAEVLTTLAASGKVSNQNLGVLAKGVMDFSKATGKSVAESAKAFIELAEKPASSVRELDKQYHFLTASVYKQIIALEKQGRVQEAAALAQSELAKAAKNMNEKVTENLGSLERFGRGAIELFTDLKNTLLSIGREQTTQQKIWDINLKKNEQFAEIEKERADIAKRNQGASDAMQAKNNAYFKEQYDARKKIIAGYDAELSKINTKSDAEAKAAAEKATLLRKEEDLKRKIEQESKGTKTDPILEKIKNLQQSTAAWGVELQAAKSVFGVTVGIAQEETEVTKWKKKSAELAKEIEQTTDDRLKKELLSAKTVADEIIFYSDLNKELKEANDFGKQYAENHKKISEEADSLLNKYGGELVAIERASDIEQQRIRNNALLVDSAGQLIDAEQKLTAAKKATIIADATGDPVAKINAEYQARLLAIQQLGLAEADALRAKDALNTEFEAKRVAALQQQFSQNSILNKMMVDGVNALTGAMSTQIAGLLAGTVSLRDAMNSLGMTILNSVIKNIIDWGVKKLWLMGVEETAAVAATGMLAAQTTAAIAAGATLSTASALQGAAVTAAWTPAAIAASIATFGGASITGGAAYNLALLEGVAASRAASLPMKDNGGYIPAGSSAIVGEYGGEAIVSGPASVISRRETMNAMGGSGTPQVNITVQNNAGVSVEQSIDSEGNILLVLEKVLPNILSSQAGNPKSALNKSLGNVWQMNRA